jgi:hypothetical protein
MRALVGLIAVCACVFAVPAAADDVRNHVTPFEPAPLLRGLVREDDVTLLFDFLRSSLAAAMQGREAPPVPAELAERAEAVSQALKLQGALAALTLLNVLEQRAKQALREVPEPRALPPPTQPFTPVQN